MATTRTTVRTIERGVRVCSNSKSGERVAVCCKSRSGSPIDQVVKANLQSFVDHSHIEKNELSKLNDRMSTFVNRVRLLENENTHLMRDINDLQLNWGCETRQIRDQYEQNLFDMRGRIDDVSNLKTMAEVRQKRASYENSELKNRIDHQVKSHDMDNQKIKKLESELCQLMENGTYLKKSFEEQLLDLEKYRIQRDETWTNLIDVLDKLDDELYRRIAVEYNNQTLREHIEFVKQINEKELLEMSQLGEALPFTDQIEFYKDQLKRVINNIRKDYEQLHLEQARELEEWMNVKTQELAAKAAERDPMHELELNIQLENMEQLRDQYECNLKEIEALKDQHEHLNKRLTTVEQHVETERNNINLTLETQSNEAKRLNEELDALLNDYNHINENKATLEYEIQVYKRLLDSQLDRITPKIAVCEVQQLTDTSVSSNAFGGKVQNKKEKKGSLGICDSSPDGKFVIIENVGQSCPAQVVDLSGWCVKRKVDGNNEICFKIPNGVQIQPNKELVIWANSYKQQRNGCDLCANELENWGIGINSVTRLCSPAGEEKSSFHQQITFSSRY